MNADPMREAVRDAIAEALGDAYDCTRVWNAWSYGTMGPDDFSLVREDSDRLNEIADAALQAMARMAAVPAPVAPAWREFPEQVPDPDTECLVEVAFNGGLYRGVDTWEMQRDSPVEWSSATVDVGFGWSTHDDVQRWIPISSITRWQAPVVPEGWKVVPVVADHRMEEAGSKAGGLGYRDVENISADDAGRVWDAMLAVAPEVPRG